MRKNRQRVAKTKICVSIPTELLDECDLYIENYSAYFTSCLKNKLESVHKKQMKQEETDIIQINRSNSSKYTAVSSTLPKNTPIEESYEELLQEFKARKARKEQQ